MCTFNSQVKTGGFFPVVDTHFHNTCRLLLGLTALVLISQRDPQKSKSINAI